MKASLILAALAASLAACSWGIKLDSGGEKVRVAWDGNVGGCKIGRASCRERVFVGV